MEMLLQELANEKKKVNGSPTGNRTPVFRVTGGDTDHYTIEEGMREPPHRTMPHQNGLYHEIVFTLMYSKRGEWK